MRFAAYDGAPENLYLSLPFSTGEEKQELWLEKLGALEKGLRLLMGAPDLAARPLRPYGWLMTNYWETNFDASLGGFHEFRYRVEWGAHIEDSQRALTLCRNLNHGLKGFRSLD